jgi:hypothetical protein
MICGIDPGISGAIAIVGKDIVTILDMPTLEITVNGKKKRQIDLYALARFFDLHGTSIKKAVIEDPHASPGAGVVSMFNFGFSCGAAQAIVAAQFCPMQLVRPAIWKKAMGLTSDKDLSRRMASQMLPHYSHMWNLKKHDGRAEAVLLAKYGETH